jgi:hypothetical protein
MYQLDAGLAYSQKALEYGFVTHHMLYSIATVYLWRNELALAEENFQSALAIAYGINDTRMLPVLLYSLVQVSITNDDAGKAEEYLLELEKLQKEHTTSEVTNSYKFAKILIYKASSNISDWGKAIELLHGILQDADLPATYKIDALYSMLEIRIKELQIQPTEEALLEVQKQLTELQREAEDKKLYMLQINAYRLKSKIALIELNINKALELLVTSKTLA